MLQLKLHAPIRTRQCVRMKRMPIQRLLRNTKRQTRLIIAQHFNILLQIEIVIAQFFKRANDRLGSSGGIRLGLLVTFRDFQFVARERRWELGRQVLQSGLHGDYLLSHIWGDDGECVTGQHVLHQFIAISAGGSHDEWQFVFSIEDGVVVHRGWVGVIDGQNIRIAHGFSDACQGGDDFVSALGGCGYQTYVGGGARDIVRYGDSAGFHIGPSHGDGGEGESFAEAGFGGGSGHGAGHTVDHDAEGGRIVGTCHLEGG
mmetsp:Transcript_24811/g.51912  ORF Transcript_24811/g.51912 Transcript_24811/m.51912 type:complete len:259 (+) Transcript_24811:332-1108(+)